MRKTRAPDLPTPVTAQTTATRQPPIAGIRKVRRRLFHDARRHGSSGATPISSSRPRPSGVMIRLNHGFSRTILFPLYASEITGNSVPHRIARQLASSRKLFSMKLDSRETTFSMGESLLR